jgi:hypothetical protein
MNYQNKNGPFNKNQGNKGFFLKFYMIIIKEHSLIRKKIEAFTTNMPILTYCN